MALKHSPGQAKTSRHLRRLAEQRTVVIFVLLFALVATIVLISVHATTSTGSIEPESGTVTSPATVCSGNNLSNGGCVQFGQASQSTVSGYGMNTLKIFSGGTNQVGTLFQNMHDVGVTWMREDFEWSAMEPTKGNYTWGSRDTAVDQAVSHGINVLATIDYSPSWAHTGGIDDHYPPDNPDDYANFAAAAVNRYKSKVHYWEIWNEENYNLFWRSGPDPARYTTLLQKAYAAIKQADPTATVISGGLTIGDNYLASKFLTNMYADNGGTSTGLFDAVGMHPYCADINPVTSTDSWCVWYQMNGMPAKNGIPQNIRDIMVAHGDSGKQIWPTEYGVCNDGGANNATIGNDLTDAYNEMVRIDGTVHPYLGPIFWYDWSDDGSAFAPFGFCGLVTGSGAQKSNVWQSYYNVSH